MSAPVLSICIPTYNHAKDLAAALNVLTALPSFSNVPDVEIVISDNASEDGTEQLCRSFVERFPDRIRYVRNERNVGDDNFVLSLTRGTGVFRKLANDTLLFTEHGLSNMLDAVLASAEETERPVLFFTNQAKPMTKVTCVGMDAFFSEVSFWSTWIGGFGIWAEDLSVMDDMFRGCALQLMQVDVLCRTLSLRKKSLVCNFRFADAAPRSKKGGYDIAQVFGINYFSILQPYVDGGELSVDTFVKERLRMLKGQLLPFFLTGWHSFSSRGYLSKLHRDYGTLPIYWLAMPFVLLIAGMKLTRGPMNNLFELWNAFLRIAPHPMMWLGWKLKNRHNMTAPVNVFDRAIVSVGRGSYGGIEVYAYGSPDAKLLIGNYVSIGPHVRFMLSGEHRTNAVTTYPFLAYDRKHPACEDICRGPIIVRDDVWIGMGATILSGVTIGQGAVIGAGAVVTKNVEPYAIVGGIPAKTIRYRFPKVICDRLQAIDWGSLSPERASSIRKTLSVPVTDQNLSGIVKSVTLD